MPINDPTNKRARGQSMIPKSGDRFSEKIMLKREKLDHDPIQFDRIVV
jgi:hypothetical protein